MITLPNSELQKYWASEIGKIGNIEYNLVLTTITRSILWNENSND